MAKNNIFGYRIKDKIDSETRVLLSKVNSISSKNGGFANIEEIVNSYEIEKENYRRHKLQIYRLMKNACNEKYIKEKDSKYFLTNSALGILFPNAYQSPFLSTKGKNHRKYESNKLTRIYNKTRREDERTI